MQPMSAECEEGNGGDKKREALDFKDVTAFFVESGIQPRRIKVWKQKIWQFGGIVEDHRSKQISHIFAASFETLIDKIGRERMKKLDVVALRYEWIEDCLKAGSRLSTEAYLLTIPSRIQAESSPTSDTHEGNSIQYLSSFPESEGILSGKGEGGDGMQLHKDFKTPKRQKEDDWMRIIKEEARLGMVRQQADIAPGLQTSSWENKGSKDVGKVDSLTDSSTRSAGCKVSTPEISSSALFEDASKHPIFCRMRLTSQRALVYAPPNLNGNITGPFLEMKDIYKDALGDNRRSFSYYKALSVLEKLPFKITSIDQIKGLPTLGKSLLENINEILTTGKMTKLEHFKTDERIRVISLLSTVWGIGPVIAQRLYEKGHRSLEDLKTEESLTSSQRIALKFHDDINKKIPRHEVKVMEAIVQRAAESLRPNISVVCGGSYRRGKELVGDIDIIITHPDGHSQAGLLNELLQKLKGEGFICEDLLHGPEHSTQGTDSRVDTYFGLCKYPGREQRHRIDLKVYPFEHYPFGLIAWTGNDVLNRRLRLVAESKGYKMDDVGLYPITHDEHGNKVKSDVGFPCRTEREVFDKLGVPWLEPHERNL